MFSTKLLLSSFLVASLHCIPTIAAPSRGTEFAFAFPCSDRSSQIKLVVNNENANPAILSINTLFSEFIRHETAPARSSIQIDFPVAMTVCIPDQVERKGGLLQSSIPVSVYISEYNDLSTTQFLVLPTDMLRSNYTTIPMNYYNFSLLLIAISDHTAIVHDRTITTLNKLEVVQISGINSYESDVIFADQPFACIHVYTGVNATIAPAVMALPADRLGQEYPVLVDPYSSRSNTHVVITAMYSLTSVYFNGDYYYPSLGSGQVMERALPSEATFITASEPIQVVYKGYAEGNILLGNVYPPSAFLSSAVTFRPLTNSAEQVGVATYILQLLVPLNSTGEIQLDGQIIGAFQYKRVPTSIYYYYYTNINADVHTIVPISRGARFLATVITLQNIHNATAIARFVVGVDLPVTEFDPCANSPCANNSTCIVNGNVAQCLCAPCFTGVLCDVDKPNPCDGINQCQNGGTCDFNHTTCSGVFCICAPGWTGPFCTDGG